MLTMSKQLVFFMHRVFSLPPTACASALEPIEIGMSKSENYRHNFDLCHVVAIPVLYMP